MPGQGSCHHHGGNWNQAGVVIMTTPRSDVQAVVAEVLPHQLQQPRVKEGGLLVVPLRLGERLLIASAFPSFVVEERVDEGQAEGRARYGTAQDFRRAQDVRSVEVRPGLFGPADVEFDRIHAGVRKREAVGDLADCHSSSATRVDDPDDPDDRLQPFGVGRGTRRCLSNSEMAWRSGVEAKPHLGASLVMRTPGFHG